MECTYALPSPPSPWHLLKRRCCCRPSSQAPDRRHPAPQPAGRRKAPARRQPDHPPRRAQPWPRPAPASTSPAPDPTSHRHRLGHQASTRPRSGNGGYWDRPVDNVRVDRMTSNGATSVTCASPPPTWQTSAATGLDLDNTIRITPASIWPAPGSTCRWPARCAASPTKTPSHPPRRRRRRATRQGRRPGQGWTWAALCRRRRPRRQRRPAGGNRPVPRAHRLWPACSATACRRAR